MSLIALSHHFDQQRPLALGLASLGNPVGGFLLAPIFVYTLQELSFRGTLWIFAGVTLQSVVAGMAIIPEFKRPEHNDEIDCHSNDKWSPDLHKEKTHERGKKDVPSSSTKCSAKSSLTSSSSTYLFSFLKDPIFLIVSLVFAIGNPCVYGTWFYLPSLALSRGLTKEDGARLTMINNVASAISPAICGFVTSLPAFRPHLSKVAMGILAGNALIDFALFFFLADLGLFSVYIIESRFLREFRIMRLCSIEIIVFCDGSFKK